MSEKVCVTHHYACECREIEFKRLTKQLEIAIAALKNAKEFETIYQYPEHELRHALAVELPYGISEALAEIDKLKETE